MGLTQNQFKSKDLNKYCQPGPSLVVFYLHSHLQKSPSCATFSTGFGIIRLWNFSPSGERVATSHYNFNLCIFDDYEG